MKKSTLYVNGRIYTMDPDNTVYEAMAVEDGSSGWGQQKS